MIDARPEIVRLTPARAEHELSQLAELLMDAVESGASVGFLPPLSKSAALLYWSEVIADVNKGTSILLVAFEHHIAQGAVHLALETRASGDHRAEICNLMVHGRARRRGVATALVRELESVARHLGRTLLLLETQKGSAAEKLFEALGYIRFGKVPGFSRGIDGALHPGIFFYRFQT